MRPATIRAFEISVIASQLIRIVNIVANAGAMAAALEVGRNELLIGPFANTLVAIGLALAVSRGRFAIARWFLVAVIALDVLGLGGIPAVATMIGIPFAIFSVIAILLMIAAGVLMFLPASTAWLKQSKGEDFSTPAKAREEEKIRPPKSVIRILFLQWSVTRKDED